MAEAKLKLKLAIIKEMLIPVATQGTGKQIFLYKTPDDTVPAQDFLKNLKNHKSKVMRGAYNKYYQFFKMHSDGFTLTGEKWHLLEDNTLGEYKHHKSQTRLFHLTDERMYVVLDGITGKKENKLKAGDVKRVADMRLEYLERRAKLERTTTP